MRTEMQTKVQESPAQNFTPVHTGLLQRKCALCNTSGLVEDSERDKEKITLQRSSFDQAETTTVPPIVHEVLRSPGQPLDLETRAYMEPRFGHDFGQVRVHTDAKAAESARAVNALAYTVGRDVVFGAGRYTLETASNQHLLVHELAHVVQQGAGTVISSTGLSEQTVLDARVLEHEANMASEAALALHRGGEEPVYPMHNVSIPAMQRQEAEKKSIEEKQKIDYKKAEKENKRQAKRIGWDIHLVNIKPEWHVLWSSKNLEAFSDAVATFQSELGFKGKNVDGVLGPLTWARLRPIGEVIAEQSVSWEDSKTVCTIAAKERLIKGYKRATGEKLVPKAKKKTFKIILQSIASKMLDVEEKYRGTGAAGALVYLGKGEFVSQSDTWDAKALKPGAAIQVWARASDLELLKQGEEVKSWGTAFVFLEYVGEDAMKVLHFDRVETKDKSDFEVWIGANLPSRQPR